MALGQWMRQLRKDKVVTVEECAARAGVTQPTWTEWENDVGERRRGTIKKIAIGLDVPESEAMVAAGFLPKEEPGLRFAREIEPILIRAGTRRSEVERLVMQHAEDVVNLVTSSAA